jgi:hypothetical protein
MSVFQQRFRQFLDAVVRSVEAEIAFGISPEIKVRFNTESLRNMPRDNQNISFHLIMCFTDNRLFWEEIGQIDGSLAIELCRATERNLADASNSIIASNQAGTVNFASLFSACIVPVADFRRSVSEQNTRDEEQALILRDLPQLRSKILPYMEIIGAFLGESHIHHNEFSQKLSQARLTMTSDQVSASVPSINVGT